jgi:hypothetical protein
MSKKAEQPPERPRFIVSYIEPMLENLFYSFVVYLMIVYLTQNTASNNMMINE